MRAKVKRKVNVQKVLAVVALIVIVFCFVKQIIINNSGEADAAHDLDDQPNIADLSAPVLDYTSEGYEIHSSVEDIIDDSADTNYPVTGSKHAEDVYESVIEDTYLIPDDKDDAVVVELDEISDEEWYMTLSEDEIQLFAATVYLEGGIESEECQKAIASVILNRMTTQNASLESIIYAPSQFDVAPYVAYTTAPDDTMEYCLYVLQYGPTIPEYVTFFRANYYFQWGDRYKNYTSIDNTYFTYDTYLKARLEG